MHIITDGHSHIRMVDHICKPVCMLNRYECNVSKKNAIAFHLGNSAVAWTSCVPKIKGIIYAWVEDQKCWLLSKYYMQG